MKNKFKYLIIILLMTACSDDFLELNPPTLLNSGDFYQTEDQFQQALTGVYESLRGWAFPGSWLMGEMRSDNTVYDLNLHERAMDVNYYEHISDFVNDEQNSHTASKYYADYEGISRANAIIDRIDNSSISDAAKTSITAEAKFLRAFYYFDLVQFFGDVPLHITEVQNPDEAFLPRSPVEDVYEVIINDLTDAILKFSPTVTFPQKGRASIGSAKTLLANVYMVQKEWAKAETLLKDVTNLGYSLLVDYASIYDLGNKNSMESIFEVQYKMGTSEGQGSIFIYYFIPITKNTLAITGHNTTTRGGLNYPTEGLINSYEPGDLRLDASIAIAEGVYVNEYFLPESVKSIVGYTTPEGKFSKYFIRKYLHPHAEPRNTDDNWPVYRYAEVLLFLAECLNEQGKSAEALPYLNQVRVPRTGLTEITETNQDLLRNIIAHERRIELAFENKRWTDLLRTGKALSVMTAFGDSMKLHNPWPLWPSAFTDINEDDLLFPIPRTELERNPLLTQNPGYAGAGY